MFNPNMFPGKTISLVLVLIYVKKTILVALLKDEIILETDELAQTPVSCAFLHHSFVHGLPGRDIEMIFKLALIRFIRSLELI